jgi:putative peptidoglycan lipid II flippase
VSAPSPRAERGRRRQLDRESLKTGIGTLASRVTGLLRLITLAYALGGQRLADAFNLANNTPNIVHDLVLGGVLGATFIPVFIDNLVRKARKDAVQSISAVLTLAALILIGATLLFEIFAPQIIDLYTLGATSPIEHHVAVELLRLFAPQLLFYGAISLMSAVLATQDRFALVGFVAVLNNVLGIIIFLIFANITHAHSGDLLARVNADSGLLYLLGIGMTAGVAVQALALVVPTRRLRMGLRPVLSLKDGAVQRIVSLSGWTFGFVIANQLAVFIVLALAFHVGHGAVSAYTYAYTFFQLPFGVVAVSIINVASPDFARSHAAGKQREMGERLGVAAKQMLALILPATAGYLVLAKPIVALLLQHGAEHAAQASDAASVLAMFALGLPGFCLFFLVVRVLQAAQDTRMAFVLYVVENGANIVFALALYQRLGAKGLALSFSIAYTIGALCGLALLRERLGTIGGRPIARAAFRSAILSAVMLVVVAFVSALVGTGAGPIGWIKLLFTIAIGLVVYIGGAGTLGALSPWQTSRRKSR